MTPGLPRLPEPPHDPRSLLLNGRIGFRQAAPGPGARPAVIDPEYCALVLPRLAGSRRALAEPSGSLGGLRPPANVAIGPDGGIFLLDRSRLELKRFDPCSCAFVKVPSIGGEGGGARELRHPGAIAIACGNLYVCDTGVEKAPMVDPCDDQKVRDASIRGENHRVSIFSLKGFALRGHLRPPARERPWRPVSIAVDSLGRVWVGDLERRLHRFSPSGRWERSWSVRAFFLAIDCRDRVYAIGGDVALFVRVLDAEGRPITGPVPSPEELRPSFPRLPFDVDREGRLWLERCCDPCAVKPTGPSKHLVFDMDGQAVAIEASPATAIFEASATYRSEALDSRIAQCVWHRIVLFGSLPAGARVRVRAFCADERLTDGELDALAAWRGCAVADAFDRGDRWDCLVRAEPGRYLHLELELEGNGKTTPSIGAIVVEFPRVSLRRFLPGVFGHEPISADFTDRFLALFDTPLRSIERQVDDMARLFDPVSAPAFAEDPRRTDFLTWLGRWIGVAVDRNWDVSTRRRFLKNAGALFDRRGTVSGLRRQLLALLDFDRHVPCEPETRAHERCAPAPRNCGPEPEQAGRPEWPPLVLEHFRLRRWLRLGAGRLGDDAVVWGERIVGRTRLGTSARTGVTRLDTSPDPEHDPFLVHANQFSVFVPARCSHGGRSRKALENLLKTESPAGTRGTLHFVEPRFRIGVQSMLGFDAVVASVPQGMRLGETALGAASMLATSPHLEAGPAIVVGKEGRLGTTTRLG